MERRVEQATNTDRLVLLSDAEDADKRKVLAADVITNGLHAMALHKTFKEVDGEKFAPQFGVFFFFLDYANLEQ